MVILSHQMIPHLHHDSASVSFSDSHTQVEKLSHHDDHGHHHHKDHHHHDDKNEKSDARSHSFPPHNHTLASDDYNFARLTIGSGKTLKAISFFVLYTSGSFSIIKQPPLDKERLYPDKPFLIKSLFKPGAIGLRAPPSIA